MTQRRRAQWVAVLALVSLLGAGCASTASPSASTTALAGPSGTGTPAPGISASPGSTPRSSAWPAGASVGTGSCGATGASPCPTVPVAFARAIPFTPPVECGGGTQCQLQLDVYYPSAGTAGGPWPLIVAIPGGPAPLGVRAGLSGLALALAAQGALVVAADYRSLPSQDAGFPQTFEDVACAVRTARALAARYGGDPTHVTLVANSLGGWPGAVVAFSPQPFPLDATSCLAQSGTARPDAFVGVAGIYSLDQIDPGYLDGFFGGSRETAPGAWATGDPYAIVTANRDEPIGVTLVGGTRDQTVPLASTQLFTGYLRAAGYAARLVIVPGATHDSVLTAPQTISAILAAARRR